MNSAASAERPTGDDLGFDGEPFDPIAGIPGSSEAPRLTSRHALPATNVLAEIRSGIVESHRAALATQLAVQRLIFQRALVASNGSPGERPAQPTLPDVGPAPEVAAPEGAFKPLARSSLRNLDRDALLQLAAGDVATVFGDAYEQFGANPDVRIAAATALTLQEVTELGLRGGTLGHGSMRGRYVGDPLAAAVQATETFALFAGLHLCLADATLVSTVDAVHTLQEPAQGGELELIVTVIDLVPRPHLVAEVVFGGARASVSVTVTVTEKPGVPVGPSAGGTLDTWTGRVGAAGDRVLLSELHMAHLARGDQATALGPEFARYTGRRATRLPTGGLLLVDRVVRFDGVRGTLDQQVAYESEYDSPSDSWYYADSANESMPHFVYMETSLQAALLMGFYLGPTLTEPDTTLSLRNLGGTATVLRQVDLRDKTIHQQSRLLSTTLLPGSSLQSFDYTLSVDGEPFYEGETMFGYFSDDALGNQTGLDAGQLRPSWLEQHPGIAVRQIDLTVRRRDPHSQLCSRNSLALLDRIDVVEDGGDFGIGYLHALRRIDPDDWFFTRHFHRDPVIPGSLGVETVIQAMQEWALDSGLGDDLIDPGFDIPAGVPFTWKYRGQFLPTDGSCEVEVHIKGIHRRPGSVTVTAKASLWKPGLRIYELENIAIELRERKELA